MLQPGAFAEPFHWKAAIRQPKHFASLTGPMKAIAAPAKEKLRLPIDITALDLCLFTSACR
jgi:hypothetical protein